MSEFVAVQFADWVRRLRKNTPLNQVQTAEKAGVSVDQVRRFEQGENVGVWYVAAILSALAETAPRKGREAPISRLEHAAWKLVLEDGLALRRAGVLLGRRRKKPQERTARRSAANQ